MDLKEQELSVLEQDLRRDLEAVTRVRRLIAFKNGSLTTQKAKAAPEPINISVADQLHLDDAVDTEIDAPLVSLRGTIESTVNADTSIRWTVQKMVKHLTDMGFNLKAQKPVFSVGQAMRKLADQGRIKLIRKGSGSEPNIYKGKEKEERQV